MNIIGSLTKIWLIVNDYDKCLSFYRDTLGIPLVSQDKKNSLAEFEAGMGEISIVIVKSSENEKRDDSSSFNNVIPDFTVSDAHGTADKLKDLGVKVDDPIEIEDKLLIIKFYDPEGNQLQLTETLFDTENAEEY